VIRALWAVRRRPGRTRRRGQSLVEFALVIPLILLMLIGLINFGFLFYSHMTLEYATREGARVASALANGGGTLGCGTGQSPNWATVDDHTIAAVQRVLVSAGITVRLDPSDPNRDGVEWIRIYRVNDAQGNGWNTANNFNEWRYSAGGGPSVGGTNLDFREISENWRACARSNVTVGAATLPDVVGVAIRYRKVWNLPLLGNFVGSVTTVDKTVMALNPTYP
jgi:hypothetical protein